MSKPEANVEQRATLLDRYMQLAAEYRESVDAGLTVVRPSDRPEELNDHGFMRWYLHPELRDAAIRCYNFYVQRIPPGSRTGRQETPGGIIFYAWKGRGRTLIQGTLNAWETDDLIMLPLLPEGVVFQHFNDDPEQEALLIACEPNFAESLGLNRAAVAQQRELAPEAARRKRRSEGETSGS